VRALHSHSLAQAAQELQKTSLLVSMTALYPATKTHLSIWFNCFTSVFQLRGFTDTSLDIEN